MVSPRIHQKSLLKQETTYNDSQKPKTILKYPQQPTVIKKSTMNHNDPQKVQKELQKPTMIQNNFRPIITQNNPQQPKIYSEITHKQPATTQRNEKQPPITQEIVDNIPQRSPVTRNNFQRSATTKEIINNHPQRPT